MIRNNTYTEYNGKEYRLVIHKYTNRKEKEYSLVSNLIREGFKEGTKEMHNAVAELLKQGFHRYSEGTYIKYIDKEDIREVYHITTYVKYQGYEFSTWMDNKEQICFVTCDWELARKLGFEPFLDQYSWVKWVDKDKVDIFEEKEIVQR